MMPAVAIWRRLDMHATARDCARAAEMTGRRMPIMMAMIPMTTSSSTSVNARRRMGHLLRETVAEQRPAEVSDCWRSAAEVGELEVERGNRLTDRKVVLAAKGKLLRREIDSHGHRQS